MVLLEWLTNISCGYSLLYLANCEVLSLSQLGGKIDSTFYYNRYLIPLFFCHPYFLCKAWSCSSKGAMGPVGVDPGPSGGLTLACDPPCNPSRWVDVTNSRWVGGTNSRERGHFSKWHLTQTHEFNPSHAEEAFPLWQKMMIMSHNPPARWVGEKLGEKAHSHI